MFIQSNKVPADVKAHAVKYGDGSHLPPNFKEITAAKFAASKFFVYSPDFWEYRQINAYNDPKGAEKFTGDLRLAYFYDGTGIAFASHYHGGGYVPRFFSFALCEHREKTCKNVGNCLSTYTCVACSYAETVDSSD
jgi:hypothetical protein